MKKIYMFYLIYPESNESILYAWTDDKEYAKRFKEFRNMDVFIEKKKEFKQDDYNLFNKHYSGMRLINSLYKTNSHNIIEIVSTKIEEENVFIKSDRILEEMAKYTIDLFMVKNTYLKSLNKLNYFYIYKYYHQNNSYFYEGISINKDCIDIDFDQFSLFVYFNKYTLK